MYSNIDEALKELNEMAAEHPELPYRVGTGEVIDSLSLDEISLYSRQLITFFRQYPKWTLEFKTKSDKVSQFLECEHAGNVVVSWSINAPEVIEKEEHGTANFQARLQAARQCANRGFQIAFHIDPLIFYPGWKEGYQFVIDEIARRFTPKEINVISLGALRFQPEQRHLMRERFGMNSWVTGAEVFPDEGGKMRYDRSLRNEMFDYVLKSMKSKNPDWRIFLCMETPESWISSYDKTPRQVPELRDLFRPLPKIPAEISESQNNKSCQ
jgi:spore photoproduct lyase